MNIFRCALRTLRTRREGFRYGFHSQFASDAKGLYAFWLAGGACLYVGKGNIRQRMYNHRMREHNGDLDRFFSAFERDIEVSYVRLDECSDLELRDLERNAIRTLRPVTNKQHN